ncbi:MAG: outer membrane protein [Oceanicoccus sp.]|jgi:outer membrane protein
MKTLVRGSVSSLILSVAILTSSLLSAEESRETSNDDHDRSGGYLKIGYGYKFEKSPYHDEKNGASVFLSGRYQFGNGIYVEASHGANELSAGNSVGYNFYNTDHWNFDIHGIQAHGRTEMGFGFKNANDENAEIEVLHMDRKATYMLGLRATHTFDQTIFQFTVAPYSFNDEYDDGVFATAWAGRSWQIKNWEIHASAGINYRSEEIINYYYSTSDEIVAKGASSLGPYQADGGFDVTGQIGVSYPVSKNILFESYLRYTDVSDSISDSPVMQGITNLSGRAENVSELGILFSYVF